MKTGQMCVWILTVAIAFGVGTIPQTASAKGEFQASDESKPVQHQIVQIKDLIEDFDESEWTAVTENGGKFGANIGGVERAKKGQVTGYFDLSGNFVESDLTENKTINIDAEAIGDEKITQVRGAYTLQLPELKRIQLEVMYDLNVVEEGKMPESEFFVEIFEHNRANQNEWVKMGEIKHKEQLKPEQPNLKKMRNECFITRNYVVNLSEWSGKDIRLDIVSSFIDSRDLETKGRWLCLRMMGATFDFGFGKLEEKYEINGLKVNSSRKIFPQQASRKKSSLTPKTIDGDFSSGYSISIPGLSFYPESFTVIEDSNGVSNWFLGYFQAGIPCFDQFENGTLMWPGSGAVVCDFYGTSSDYFDASNTIINASMIRDSGSGLVQSNNSNYPIWRALSPTRDVEDDFANGMTAVSSAFKDGSYVHAFFHAEDWFLNNQTRNIGYEYHEDPNNPGQLILDPLTGLPQKFYGSHLFWAYCRIGYARSDENDSYNLNITQNLSGNPVITSFQSEGQLEDYEYPAGSVFGAAHPLLLNTGTDLYLYYNRFLEYEMIDGDPYSYIPKTSGGIGREACSLCVAKASYSSVISMNYANQSNPWYKYYGGSFTQPGIGGLSTPLFDLCDSPHGGYLIPASVMDHEGIDEYVFVFMNPPSGGETSNQMYLCISNNRCPYDLSNCIEVELPNTRTGCVALISEDGYETHGNGENMMMYCHEPSLNLGFSMVKYNFYFYYP